MRGFGLMLGFCVAGMCSCRPGMRVEMPGWYTQPRAVLETDDRWVSVGSGSSLAFAREQALSGFAQRLRASVRVVDRARLRGDQDRQESVFTRDVLVESHVLVRGARMDEVAALDDQGSVAVIMSLDLVVMAGELQKEFRNESERVSRLIANDQNASPLERVMRLSQASRSAANAWEYALLLGAMGKGVETEKLASLQQRASGDLDDAVGAMRVQVRESGDGGQRVSDVFLERADDLFRIAHPPAEVDALLWLDVEMEFVRSTPHPSGVWSSMLRWEIRVRLTDALAGGVGGTWYRQGVAFGSTALEAQRDAREQMESVMREELAEGLQAVLRGQPGSR